MVPKELLKSIPFFTAFPDKTLDRLAQGMREEQHPYGTTLFEEGQKPDGIYFLLDGQILIRKALQKEQGTFKVITSLEPGEFFGEMSLLDKSPRSAAAWAQSPVKVLHMSMDDFDNLMEDKESGSKAALELLRALVLTLNARLKQTTGEMVAVFEVGRTLSEGLETRPLASRILSLLINSFEAKGIYAAFFFWNEYMGEYEIVAKEGEWPQWLMHSRRKSDLLFNYMSEMRECLLSKDWISDERFLEEERAAWHGCRSFLAAPVIGLRGTLGFLIFSHGEKPGIFTTGHRQVLAGVANLAATGFENVIWRQELEAKRKLEQLKSRSH